MDAKDVKIGNVPQHVVNMLFASPAEDASAVVQDTLKMATTFFNAQEKIEEGIDNDLNEINTRAYNAILSIQDFEKVPQSTLQSLLPPNIYENLPATDTSKEELSGIEVKNILSKSLKGQFWANPTQTNQIEGALRSTGGFAEASDPLVLSNLYVESQNGQLTIEDLNAQKVMLTSEDYIRLAQNLSNQGNANLNQGKRLMSTAFNYQAGDTTDDDLSKASKNAYANAENALILEFNKNKALGKTMTLSEILNFSQAQVAEFGKAYLGEQKAAYRAYISSYSRDQLFGYIIDPKDPIGSIEEWFNSLSADEQKQKRNVNRRSRFLRRMRQYQDQDLF